MSSARIWAVDARAARAAGWSRTDLWWEGLQARAKSAQLTGSHRRAAALWLAAWTLGALSLPAQDLRRACALENAACGLDRLGLAGMVRSAHSAAQRRWSAAAVTAEALRLEGRARSSLFHLRLAQRHSDVYAENTRRRLLELHGEAAEWLDNPSPEPSGGTCRWVVERPPVYDDSRKWVAACCLLACAQPRRDAIERDRD